MSVYRFTLDIELDEYTDDDKFFEWLFNLAIIHAKNGNVDLCCALCPPDACLPHEVTS